jgi:hypothetical protein
VIEAAPAIVLRLQDKTSSDGISMNVSDLFNSLLGGVDVEVVVTALPELLLVGSFEFTRG